ncbi:MAG TPA: hypothetical protein VNF05_06920 [Acidimicrobiales bacterium]|nr:hypothetical protein [Acidimicrobiales bacterium]
MSAGVIFPELLSGREDGWVPRPWTVREGSTARGSASCNLADRILEVPLGPSAQARVVRAHELMHARVSPHVEQLMKALDEVSPRALECAEELRVNTLLARLHFDTSLLRDGTEKIGGRRVADAGEWAEAVCFLMAVVGTGAEREYLAGIRQGRPSWLPALRAIRKRALALVAQFDTPSLASTRLDDEGRPIGYATSTLVIARLLTQTLEARVPTTPEELRTFRRSLEVGGRRPATGHFAELVFDASIERRASSPGASVRRTRATTTGTSLRYPGRLVTDDHRRAFAQRRRVHGGVVVIDQSGSMDLEPQALVDLVRRAPNALVLGYSHRPGDLGSTPNAWLLCDRGTVANTCPSGNVGNGVDGPALRWALGQRTANEPVVWVTDGQVTDSHDHPDVSLTLECANLVRRHRIRLVRDLVGASKALREGRPLTASRLEDFGRVGHQLREIVGK